jgi:hypothetical protein
MDMTHVRAELAKSAALFRNAISTGRSDVAGQGRSGVAIWDEAAETYLGALDDIRAAGGPAAFGPGVEAAARQTHGQVLRAEQVRTGYGLELVPQGMPGAIDDLARSLDTADQPRPEEVLAFARSSYEHQARHLEEAVRLVGEAGAVGHADPIAAASMRATAMEHIDIAEVSNQLASDAVMSGPPGWRAAMGRDVSGADRFEDARSTITEIRDRFARGHDVRTIGTLPGAPGFARDAAASVASIERFGTA